MNLILPICPVNRFIADGKKAGKKSFVAAVQRVSYFMQPCDANLR